MSSWVKPLLLRDEVHGDLELDGCLRPVIDHETFQRLRYIKQMGLAEYVFPGATHTRFQHSLGAGYLAGKYFDSVLSFWTKTPFRWDGACGSTKLLGIETEKIVRSVAECDRSRPFWRLVATLSGLLHDIGHGPWSHAFEALPLQQNLDDGTRDLPAPIARYFQGLKKAGVHASHEDFSVLYLARLLHDCREALLEPFDALVLAVASLVNKPLYRAEGVAIERSISESLGAKSIAGGASMLRLLRPMVSGPFDADRMDYIQRDARNCGVSIGGIEWTRIQRKVVPCLAEHANDEGEPGDVVLLSHVKNQHVLDDFVFSLFQMYAQVYLHPKVVGIEESLHTILAENESRYSDYTVTWDEHRKLTDERFRWMIRERFGIDAVDDLLFRRVRGRFRVLAFPAKVGESATKPPSPGLEPLDVPSRAMWKDGVGVFLFSSLDPATGVSGSGSVGLWPWTDVSPVAARLRDVEFAPRFWVQRNR